MPFLQAAVSLIVAAVALYSIFPVLFYFIRLACADISMIFADYLFSILVELVHIVRCIINFVWLYAEPFIIIKVYPVEFFLR